MPPTATSARGGPEWRAQHHRAPVICSGSQGSLQINTASQAAPSHYIIPPVIVVAQRYELRFSQTITKIILFCSLSNPPSPTFIPCPLPSFAARLWGAQREGFPRLSPSISTTVQGGGSDHSGGQLSSLCRSRRALLLPPSSLPTFCERSRLIAAPVPSTVCAAPQHTAKGYPLSSPVH